MQTSPFSLAKAIEGGIGRLLAPIDIYELSNKERSLIERLRRDIVDARLEVRDYELAETRQFQLANAKKAKYYLAQVNKQILLASEANLFSPADVAHLSAQVEQLSNNLN